MAMASIKAKGLCITPILQQGLPADEAVERMISEINQELEQNTRDLKECIDDVMKLTARLPGGKNFTFPKEAVEYMAHSNILEKSSCYDPESEDVTKLLRHVLQVLDKNPGCEEEMLASLLQLSSKEGVTLPIRSSKTDHVMESMVSIGTVTDMQEQVNESLWNEIRTRFRKYFIDCLRKLPTNPVPVAINLNDHRRLDCIHSLCALYPTSDVWKSYKSVRSTQLETCMNTLLYDDLGELHNMEMVAKNFEELADTAIAMINDDFLVLNSGIFRNVVTTFQAIHQVFLEKISHEISLVVENLRAEIAKNIGAKLPKSESEFGFVQNLKSNLKKGHSKSLDSLLSKDEIFTDVSIPPALLQAVVKLVSAIGCIERHVDDLHKTMIWEVMGTAGKKIKPRSDIRGVLKSSSNSDMSSTLSSSLSETKDSLLFNAISNFTDSTSSFTVVEKVPHEEKPKWNWCSYFKPVVPDIAKSLEQVIRIVATKAANQVEASYDSSGGISTVPVCQDLVGGNLDYPKKVAQDVADLMKEFDSLLPLILCCHEGPFLVIKSSFLDTVTIHLRNVHRRLTKVGMDCPKEAPFQLMYISVASAAFIRNHLLHYDTVLGGEDGSKKCFPLLYRQFCELVDSLCKRVVELQNNVLVGSLLHDAESHAFEDQKEFYEDERCSFSIQMWNLHMSTLRHDLWETCPPKLAQNMFTSVLQETLAVFCQRYNHMKPTYKRTPQFRSDITAILMCTSELLYPACSNVSMLIDVCPAYNSLYSIHNSCTALLAALTIVTAPLEQIYRVFKKGFTPKKKKKDHASNTEGHRGHPCHWLSWIQPGMYKHDQRVYDDMQTTNALCIQLRLMVTQPEHNWPLLLQLIVMKDYTLPIMLLTHYATQGKGISSLAKTNPGVACNKLGCPGDPDIPCVAGGCTQNANMYRMFLNVLVHCSHAPDALAKVLIPVIDRTNCWGLFDATCVPGKTLLVPEWLSMFFELLTPLIERVLDPVIRIFMSSRHSHQDTVEPLVNVLDELPCGCDLMNKAKNKQKKDVNDECLKMSLHSMVKQLADDIYSIAPTLGVFFKLLQHKVQEKGVKSAHNCVAIQILGACIRCKLLDSVYLEGLIGIPLRATFKEYFVSLGEAFYHVLTSSNKGDGTPRITSKFMKHNKDWIQTQILRIRGFFTSDIYDTEDSTILDGATVEFSELLFTSLASTILATPTGHTSLVQISNLLHHNQKWIEAQLDIQPINPDEEPAVVPAFILNFTNPAEQEFNPLQEFRKIGSNEFSHSFIGEFPYDWSKLLHSDLGLSEVGFRNLLYHRHEMQEGAYLEESEKKPVEMLKSRFDIEASDLV